MPGFFPAFRDVIHRAGARHEVPSATLDLITRSAWELLCHDLGARCVYIPRPAKATRNAAIVAAWRDGQTLAQIAAEHRVTSNRIRQIVEAEGALDR